MALALHEKISIAEARQWLLTAHEEWTGKHTDSLTDEALAALEAQIVATKPVDFKAPRKPRASKASTSDSERMNAEHDDSKCDARIWLKGGFAAQCSCAKVDGQFFCKKHQKEADSHGGVTKNGSFNGDRPTHHYGDESDKVIPWHDVVIEKPDKTNKSAPGNKKPRVCGCCGETGHDKRKCPKNTANSSPPMTAAEAVAAAEAALAAAKAAAAKETAEASSNEVISPAESPAESPVELDEDVTEVTSGDSGAGVGLSTTVEESGYQSDTTVAYVPHSDEEEETELIDCSFEGIKYSRSGDGIVRDDDDEEVGKWVNGAIEFDASGKKCHRYAVAAL